jgi:hypothetical protein
MDSENIASTMISSNYAGICEHEPLTNTNILRITKPAKDTIDGPTLFALKYRMLPCTLERRWDEDKQCTEKYNKPGVIHATRSVNRFYSLSCKLIIDFFK